jgi:hypothetical protein
VHQLGLVAVLAELHAELDAAVLAAYGWSDLAAPPHSLSTRGEGRGGHLPLPASPTAWGMSVDSLSTCGEGRGGETAAANDAQAVTLTLLTRLLALNHARAAEETAGSVRWLRPAFQHPQPSAAPPTQAPLGMDGAGGRPVDAAARIPEPPAQPWPAALPEQMRAVADVLAASPQPLDLEALAPRFKGRGPWKKSLPRILDTLEALGRARREEAGWRG